jgi:nucleotide-binding universal stress UspA family protein
MCVSHGQAGAGMVTLGRALTGSDTQGAPVYALHLIPPTERASFHMKHDSKAPEEGALAPLLKRAQGLGLEVRPLSFVSAEPGADICRTAEAKRADLILLGWHKPLFSRTMLGGTVHEVMRGAGTDVAVLVDRGLTHLRRVLVPFIGTPHDRAALGLAQRLLRHAGAEITLLHVTSPDKEREGARTRVEELFPEDSGRVRLQVVAHASPEDAALEESRKGYDLVVVGVGPEWGLEEQLFGLQRERMIQDAPASLLVVRHPRTETSDATAPEADDSLPAGSPAA